MYIDGLTILAPVSPSDGFGAFGGLQLPQPPHSRHDPEGGEAASAGSREFMLKEDNRFGGLDDR